MAVLDAANRRAIMGQLVRTFAYSGLTKPDVQAAVDALDTFLEDNAVTINAAFPLPFRSVANASQKAAIVAYVALRRAGLLKVEGE